MSARIVMLGAGKVGTALTAAFHHSGQYALQWYNRSLPASGSPADKLSREVPILTDLEAIDREASLYLIAVSDKAIPELAAQLSNILPPERLVAHTSGATGLEGIAMHFDHHGVFYPLQTFAPGRHPDLQQVPICIESHYPEDLNLLAAFAGTISNRIEVLSSEQRRWLHVAAVLVNNFVNQLFTEAYDLLQGQEIPFDLLLPLIRETVGRLESDGSPAHWQTGPAIRKDEPTLNAHRRILKEDPEMARLYQLLSERIQQRNDKK